MSSAGFDSLFDDLIKQSQEAFKARQEATTPELPEVEGKAFDDRITVRMRNGRVTSVELQPQTRKIDNVTLGEHLVEAFNQAVDKNLEAMIEQSQDDEVDLQNLGDQLRSIQAESVRQLEKYTDGMVELLKQSKQNFQS